MFKRKTLAIPGMPSKPQSPALSKFTPMGKPQIFRTISAAKDRIIRREGLKSIAIIPAATAKISIKTHLKNKFVPY